MSRKYVAILAIALCCAYAHAQEPEEKVDPVAAAAAGAVGAAVGPAVSTLTGGLLRPEQAAVVTSNLVLAGDSAKTVHSTAGKLVGGLLSKSLEAHRQAGQILVNIVSALNSLHIAGANLAAGVTNNALSGLIGHIRTEALAIGNLYTDLLGEFGRFVGGSVTAVQTLKRGVFTNPLALGVGHLERSLQNLITFLEAAVSPAVTTPQSAALFLPHLATLKAVRALLQALSAAVKGPAGALTGALDDAVTAAGGLLGGAAPTGQPGVTNLIATALDLISKIPGI